MRFPAKHSEAGLTLIEVLVALVVLSIGMLGLAALQASGIKFNHDSYLRSQATNLAYDVIERMRIDEDKATANNFSDTYTAADPADNCDFSDTSTAAAKLCWRTEIRDTLPNGSLVVSDAYGTNSNQFTITISWQDRWQQEGSSTTQSVQTWMIEL